MNCKKRLDRPDREKIRGLIEKWNRWNQYGGELFTMENLLDQILALIPGIVEGSYEVNIRVNKILAKVYKQHKVDIEEAKKQERERIEK